MVAAIFWCSDFVLYYDSHRFVINPWKYGFKTNNLCKEERGGEGEPKGSNQYKKWVYTE